jgi:protein TonB
MSAIRAPFSALGGVALSSALFFGLWRLVDVPMLVGEKLTVVPVELPKVRPNTPIVDKRTPPPVREAPLPQPNPPRIGTTGGGTVEPVPYNPPTIGPVIRGNGPNLGGIDGDVIPRVRVNPDYPPNAAGKNIEGWVRVQFTVTAIGTVKDAVVVGSEPGTIFDDAALKAIARWRYNPRVVNGEAVERVGVQTMIRFELQ